VIPRRFAPVAVVAVLLLAGCSTAKPVGTDGNLVNGWPAVPAAHFTTATVGACYNSDASLTAPDDSGYRETDCTQSHTMEIAAVKTWTGAAATRAAVPVDPDPDYSTARTTCVQAANDYMAGDYRSGRVFLKVGVPDARQWAGGDRFYTCELGADNGNGPGDTRTSSVKGGLGGARPAAIGCTQTDGSKLDADGTYADVTKFEPVDCSQPHDSEFVAATDPMSDALPDDSAAQNQYFTRSCYLRITAFLGVAVATSLQRTDLYPMWWWQSDKVWANGDHGVQCFVVLSGGKRISSTLLGWGTTLIK
jgi:hypothetical protein